MNKVRWFGLLSLIIGVLGSNYLNEYDFLAGIFIGIGIAWLLTGKFLISNRKSDYLKTNSGK
jgi:hypothetical protein